MPKGVYERKPMSDKQRKSISESLTGRKQSKEHIANSKISKQNMSKETKLKMSKSRIGIIFTGEHCGNLSKARKEYWASLSEDEKLERCENWIKAGRAAKRKR